MRKPITQKYSPKGTMAVSLGWSTCKGCLYEDKPYKFCSKKKCGSSERDDQRDILFIDFDEDVEIEQNAEAVIYKRIKNL